jgi:CubicO group peptidase (beta-lactamase class C family)
VQYGFGWRISGEARWHSGETLGFRTVIARYLKQRFTVVVLTNRNDPGPYGAAIAIARVFMPNAAEMDAAGAAAKASGPDPGARPLPR